MYILRKGTKTTLEVNTSTEGETIEQKVEAIVYQGGSIDEGNELIYTERKDGVKAEHDIRTDRWEVAVAANDYADKTHKAKREERHNPKKEEEKAETKEATDEPKGGAKE